MRQKLDLKSGTKLAEQLEGEEGPPPDSELKGLTEEQEIILRLRLRGLTIRAIATGMKVTPAVIHRETVKIREIKAAELKETTTLEHAAEATTLYNTLESKAMEIYTDAEGMKDSNTQLKALMTAKAMREAHVKLLLELGYMEKAVQEKQPNVNINILDNLSPEIRQMLSSKIIEAQLTPLASPVPLEGEIESIVEEAAPKVIKQEEYDFVEMEAEEP